MDDVMDVKGVNRDCSIWLRAAVYWMATLVDFPSKCLIYHFVSLTKFELIQTTLIFV